MHPSRADGNVGFFVSIESHSSHLMPKAAPRKPPPPAKRDPAFDGLALLSTAVLLTDAQFRIVHANPAAETLFAVSTKTLQDAPLERLFSDPAALIEGARAALNQEWSHRAQNLALTLAPRDAHTQAQVHAHESMTVHCVITPVLEGRTRARVVIELRPIDQQLKVEREARLLEQARAHRDLIRNLAHEIKNPLGGIRGAAQLLEHELPNRELREYTQVIIKESDRLQGLMDRLLTPHRLPTIGAVNIHEVLERVRSVMRAEFPMGLTVVRDYDASLPELRGDKEQLIQVVLNIVRNAAQAMGVGDDLIVPQIRTVTLRTRIARQVTLATVRHRLALDLHIIDNGPGIPESIRDRIFDPLVSGREGGSGLGLTLAQTYVQAHHGVIEVESRTGFTDFRILLPLA